MIQATIRVDQGEVWPDVEELLQIAKANGDTANIKFAFRGERQYGVAGALVGATAEWCEREGVRYGLSFLDLDAEDGDLELEGEWLSLPPGLPIPAVDGLHRVA